MILGRFVHKTLKVLNEHAVSLKHTSIQSDRTS